MQIEVKKLRGIKFVQEAICPGMSLTDYIFYCCTGQLPASVEAVRRKSPFLNDLVCMAQLLGALEPLCAFRPGVCDPVVVVDRQISVPAATTDPDGVVTQGQERAISICAPLNRALVVKKLRLTPDPNNAVALASGEVEFKRVNLGGFGEWCLPFEPEGGPGTFVNVENIIVPPSAGFTLFGKNNSTTNPAIMNLHAEMWACC